MGGRAIVPDPRERPLTGHIDAVRSAALDDPADRGRVSRDVHAVHVDVNPARAAAEPVLPFAIARPIGPLDADQRETLIAGSQDDVRVVAVAGDAMHGHVALIIE